jgi:hypothetical protein
MSEIKVNKISPRTNCGTVTLGDSGDSFVIPAGVSITNSGTASGFGSTGEVSWNTTVKTSTFTVTAGEGFFCNTTGGAFTANLPAGTAGSSFAIADYAATFQTHNLTVSPNGSQKIGGVNADVILSTEGQSAYFVYIDDTQGWVNVIDSTSNIRANAFIVATGGNTVATCGDFKIHTFTGPGTFCVSAAGACAANNIVDYVVVAGGGGSGNPSDGGRSSGSGGAGGFRYFATTPLNPQSGNPGAPLNGYGSPSPSGTAITVTAQAYPITVGGGGAAGPEPSNAGSSGGVSTFSTVTSAGGGSHTTAGGSGGGRYHGCTSGNTAGNTPPVTPPQGQPGGYGINDNTPSGNGNYVGGAGGGAIAAGANASTSSPYGAAGGAGAGITGFGTTGESSGCKYYFSGGGGGGGQTIKGPTPGFRSAAVGGLGGGGCGQITANTAAGPGSTGQAGTANTGGGAGGGGCNTSSQSGTGAAGGSGIVIIRYKFQ